MEKSKIKILVSYHKDSARIESQIITPIHVGAKNSIVDLKMLRDDEGINISDKNDKYCELTAQYWAWKNLDAEFYGFMHYRRHFAFKDIEYCLEDGTPAIYNNINEKYKKEIGLNDDIIYHCVDGVDLILPLIVDTSTWGAVSNEVQFSCLENLHAIDFDIVCQTVVELYPNYSDAVHEFRTSHYAYWYNMFIMKKEIFVEYSEWLFSILENSERKIDFTKYNQQEIRTLAFMAERLLSIYLIKLWKDKPELKVKFLKMTFVKNADKLPKKDLEDIIELKEKRQETNYVDCVERAYSELKYISLPYDMKELFQINNKWKSLLQKKDMIFYGGGKWGRQLLFYFERLGLNSPIEIWDRDAKCNQTIGRIPVVKPDFTSRLNKDNILWIITIRNRKISNEIKRCLKENGAVNIIDNREIVNWLSYELWINVNNKN